MAEPILTHDSLYDAVSRKEVPFVGLDDEK